MSKLPLTLTILLIAVYTNAQLIVGIPDRYVLNGKELDTRTLRSLKSTETVYFYNERDAKFYEQYGDEIKKYWKINKLIFAPATEENEYYSKPGKYSFLTYNTITSIKTMSSGTPYVSALRIYLDLNVPVGRGEYEQVARLVLGPHLEDLVYLYKNYLNDPTLKTNWFAENEASNETREKVGLSNHYLYTQATFTNFYPGIFKFYLKQISENLENDETQGVLAKADNPQTLATLSEKTLIVPEEILLEYKKFKGEVVPVDREEFFKKYEHKYEIKSIADINQMLLDGEIPDDQFILVPAISNTDQYINIYSPDGEWAYKEMNAFTKEYSSKDMHKIAKAIAKAAKG